MSNWTKADLDVYYQERANYGNESVAAAHKRLTVPKAKGRHQHIPGEMNRAEKAYSEHLEMRKLAGEVAWWIFEAVTLKLAHDCRLTVDFFVMLTDGTLEAHDVKGTKGDKPYYEEDAIVKLRVAQSMFPFTFRMVFKAKSGEWIEKEIGRKAA